MHRQHWLSPSTMDSEDQIQVFGLTQQMLLPAEPSCKQALLSFSEATS